VYLELTTVDHAGGKLYIGGNLHTESATLYSILLASDDEGLTWFETYRRIRGAGLDRVFFHDKSSGWAAGHTLDGEPKDPFFLLTTDGGENWRMRRLFGDGRTALIEKFWFDSARSGGVLVDRIRANEAGSRYEHYETMTGAESWMIREVSSKPIRVRRTPGAEPDRDWRLRVGGEANAWQVQHLEGVEWLTVAQFQVEVAHCVPVVEELAEAEPEAPPSQDVEAVAPGGVFVIGRPAEFQTEKKPDPKKPQN
jgi:photosystem II stability/assembly factor-like uncharacterized protein